MNKLTAWFCFISLQRSWTRCHRMSKLEEKRAIHAAAEFTKYGGQYNKWLIHSDCNH